MNIINWVQKTLSQRKRQLGCNELGLLEEDFIATSSYLLSITICLVLFFLLIWFVIAQVDEVAKTRGEVLPQSDLILIKHGTGGTITNIAVKNGEMVQSGQPLLSLDSHRAKAELDKALIQLISLTADKIRHKAALNNQELKTTQLIQNLSKTIQVPPEQQEAIHQLLQDNALLSQIQQHSNRIEVDQIQKQIDQAGIELDFLGRQQQLKQSLLNVIKEERGLYIKLNEKNLASKKEILTITRQFIRIQQEAAEASSEYEKQLNFLQELRKKLSLVQQGQILDTANQLNDINSQILQAQKQVIKYNHELQSLTIRAPTNGLINSLTLSVGSVVAPDQDILTLVPTDVPMVIVTKIQSHDIGHVHVGDKVKIKIDAFDYIRYGTLHGKLDYVSPTTFLDEKTQHVFYKGRIQLDRQYLGTDKRPLKLIPGMLAEADIYTGRKSLASYLLKPITTTLHNAFYER